MANTDNSCANLEIEDVWTQSVTNPINIKDGERVGPDTLGDILNLQSETQKNVYGYDFENMTLREIMDF